MQTDYRLKQFTFEFPTLDGVAATPHRVAAGQGVFTDHFLVHGWLR
jgi:hypothetical protein